MQHYGRLRFSITAVHIGKVLDVRGYGTLTLRCRLKSAFMTIHYITLKIFV